MEETEATSNAAPSLDVVILLQNVAPQTSASRHFCLAHSARVREILCQVDSENVKIPRHLSLEGAAKTRDYERDSERNC